MASTTTEREPILVTNNAELAKPWRVETLDSEEGLSAETFSPEAAPYLEQTENYISVPLSILSMFTRSHYLILP